MNISNAITAPLLLIVVLVMLILFQSVFLKSPTVVIESPDSYYYSQDYGGNSDNYDYDDYIMYNGVKYYPDRILLFMIITHMCSFLLPAVFYVKIKKIDWFRNLKLTLPSPKMIPFSIYMFFILMIGTVLIDYLFFYVSNETLVFPKIYTSGNIVFGLGVFLAFILIPAACEEIVFRATLASEYDVYGVFFSMLMTSSAFAMSKFSLQLFCVYFFASVIFFICLKITNSILIPVVLHTGYSFFNIYIESELISILQFEQNRFIFLFFLTILFTVFIVLSLSVAEEHYYIKGYRNDPSPIKNSENKGIVFNFAKTFLSPTFIITIIIFFVYISVMM